MYQVSDTVLQGIHTLEYVIFLNLFEKVYCNLCLINVKAEAQKI